MIRGLKIQFQTFPPQKPTCFRPNTVAMTLSLTQEKMASIRQTCSNLLMNQAATIRELAQIVGTLTSTKQAVLSAPLHYRKLQMLKTRAFLQHQSYGAAIDLIPEAQEELRWWLHYLESHN